MKNILIYEPDKEIGALFATWLKENDIGCTSAEDPKQIPDILSGKKLDMLIMDIDPSISTGINSGQGQNVNFTGSHIPLLDLCRKLKKTSCDGDIPIIVLTYRGSVSKIADALGSGVDNFLLKPFETDSFLERIKTIFREIELKKHGKLLGEVRSLTI